MEEIRRLSAIMFTDIVGYSALTQKNERLALELLQVHAELLRTIFPKFRGTEIKTIGDAFLVEFSSALDAAECAIEIQTKLNNYNGSAQSERRLQLRIGIHLGDVVKRENDIFGDGVNIAARIEPFAVPGGVCVSEDVARQVQNKISFPLEQCSSQQLKNIALPVQLFSIQFPWLPKGQHDRTIVIDTNALHRTTIAVLPFTNIGAGNDDYFSEGITEEIISSLSKLSGLDVIARTSAFRFKDSTLDVTSIASQLGAGTILGGTVRRAGEKARISIRLMDAGSQHLMWSEDYTKDLNDIFTVQSDIAMQVASSLQVKLLASEEKNIHRQGTKNPDSFQSFLLGRFYLNKRTGESIQRSIEYFEKSISFDERNALSYAGLAEAYTLIAGAGYGSLDKQEATRRAVEASMKAIALDESLAEAHLALAYVKFRIEWNWKEAEKEFLHAIRLKQSFSKAHELYGLFLGIHRRFDETFVHIKRALELDPLSAGVHTGYGRFLTFAHRYEEAHRSISQALELDPNYAEAHFAMGDYYLAKKNYEEALACTENALSLSGRRPIILGTVGYLKGMLGDVHEAEGILVELRTMDSPAQSTLFAQANVLAGLGRIDESVEAMEKAIDMREGVAVFINADPSFFGGDEMQRRVKGMLEKIGFDTTGL
ncbi:MAG: tetratricopeptide repeat protein [Ignavibacteriales bacterium]|nr:tetratricopeptide repeat protein [Ignavibacteriales bacterium]